MSVGTFWTNISASLGKVNTHRRACSVPVLTDLGNSPRTLKATCVIFDRSRNHIYLEGVPLYQDQLPESRSMQDYKDLKIGGDIPRWPEAELNPQIILWHVKTTEKEVWASKNLKQTDLSNGEP